LLCRVLVGEVFGACCRPDAKPPVTALAAAIRELERRNGEERLTRETRRDRLGRFDKPLRVWVGGQESPERLRSALPNLRRRTQEPQEFLAGVDREAISGVRDNISVSVLAQMEADGYAPGT